MLDVFQTKTLRFITRGVKYTLAIATHLLCDLQLTTNLVWRNAAILYNRLTRLPNISFWREYYFNRSRDLRAQKDFLQCVLEIAQSNAINEKA
ncbi:hypothetical protein TNCT_251541 [Trichonephila clavata]|uniref:Uncharacterized protein n=1 Tax=Trichonephila clavata TaxID=2740835 RepID=A0A8X6LG94_TRICU|nr:hypothetical protein TNCT_251541 [Trichonephila clavata]